MKGKTLREIPCPATSRRKVKTKTCKLNNRRDYKSAGSLGPPFPEHVSTVTVVSLLID